MFETAWRDVRYATRSLRRTPAFTATAVLTLAIGIGANTTVFSLLDAVMFKPLPVAQPEQLYLVNEVAPEVGDDQPRFSYPRFQLFERKLGAEDSIAAMSRVVRFDIQVPGNSHIGLVALQLVSGGYFDTFRVSPALGRLLTDDDTQRIDAHPVAVISHAFWRTQFGGEPSVIGRPIMINRATFTVVGVAAPDFTGVWMESPVAVWIPIIMQHAVHYATNVASYGDAREDEPWARQENIFWMHLVVRASRGLAAVRTELEAAYRQDVAQYVQTLGDPVERVRFLRRTLAFDAFGRGFSGLREPYSAQLFLLMAMVATVLLIASANIAHLLLARGAARQREIRISLALGASRMRLFRELLTESLMMAVPGGVTGVLIARWSSAFLASRVLNVTPEAIPPAFALDGRVLLFAVGACVGTTLLFGVAPALRTTRVQLTGTLGTTAPTPSGRDAMTGMRPLVVMQVALSFVLVMAAGWAGHSLFNLSRLDPGFDREQLVAVSINPRNSGYSEQELPALYDRLIARLQSLPDVRSAALASCSLSNDCEGIGGMQIEGYQPAPGERLRLHHNRVGPRYFSTVGMRLREGREFEPRDNERRVAVVNEALVRRYFGGRSAIGRRIGYGPPDIEIVGVVADARTVNLRTAPVPMAYVPLHQPAGTNTTRGEWAFANSLDVRAVGDLTALVSAIQRAITEIEPRLLVAGAVTMSDRLHRNVARDTLVAYLASAFGVTALLLASLGLYGVLSYAVVRRIPELGVRMALGARPVDVLTLVGGDGARLVVPRLILGAVAAFAVASTVETLLFGVSALDPATYAAVVFVLAVVSLAACYLPARRAARVDPIAALRME